MDMPNTAPQVGNHHNTQVMALRVSQTVRLRVAALHMQERALLVTYAFIIKGGV